MKDFFLNNSPVILIEINNKKNKKQCLDLLYALRYQLVYNKENDYIFKKECK
jgi:hypothetical protein